MELVIYFYYLNRYHFSTVNIVKHIFYFILNFEAFNSKLESIGFKLINNKYILIFKGLNN